MSRLKATAIRAGSVVMVISGLMVMGVAAAVVAWMVMAAVFGASWWRV